MAKPKFYLEPRPTPNGKQAINMFYSFGGKRLQYYTGIRIDIKYFRPECNSSDTIKPVKSTAPYAAQYNAKLESIALDAVTIVSSTKAENLTVKYVRQELDELHKAKTIETVQAPETNHDFISFFKQLIDDSKTGKRLISSGKSNGSRYSYNAIKNYAVTLAAVRRYMDYKNLKSISFEAINKAFYDDFRFFCYNVESKEKSTFGVYIKDIKTVMNESNAPGFDRKEFVSPAYEADTLYLTMDQINKIAALDLGDYTKYYTREGTLRPRKTNAKSKGAQPKDERIGFETLDKVRDLFLIGAYTGLRFSDFSSLDLKSIEGSFIKIKQTKTGDRITIPIMSKLRPVLNKYPEALPSISNQNFNDYIKVVAKLAGLTEDREVKNSKGNTENKTTSPLYQLISSHACRRSYATNMFKAGIPPMLIMSATGHKTESSFLKYIRANNDDKAQLLAQALHKLGL